MFKVFFISSFLILSSVAQAFDFNQCHGGNSCPGVSMTPATYDCYGSGAEEADLILVETKKEGVFSLIGNNDFTRDALEQYNEYRIPGVTGSVANVDFANETPVCTDDGQCLEVEKLLSEADQIAFGLNLKNHAHGLVSYVCEMN